MVSRKCVKCFKQLYFKEQFQTATVEIICESCPFLNKDAGGSFNTLTANQGFQKMLQNFLGHLVHLSTEAPVGNNS